MLHTGENCMAIYVDFLLRCLGIMVSKNKLHAKGQPNNEINKSSMYKMRVFQKVLHFNAKLVIPEYRGHKIQKVIGPKMLAGLLRVEADHDEDEDEGEQDEGDHDQQLERYHV